jgi:hypothetical protein
VDKGFDETKSQAQHARTEGQIAELAQCSRRKAVQAIRVVAEGSLELLIIRGRQIRNSTAPFEVLHNFSDYPGNFPFALGPVQFFR